MTRRRHLQPLLLGALLFGALPAVAHAGPRDGGAERGEHAGREGRAPRRAEADPPEPTPESPRERRRRDQQRLALTIVGSALGVYVLYKIVRR